MGENNFCMRKSRRFFLCSNPARRHARDQVVRLAVDSQNIGPDSKCCLARRVMRLNKFRATPGRPVVAPSARSDPRNGSAAG